MGAAVRRREQDVRGSRGRVRALSFFSHNDRLTPLLTPLSAQHPETMGNREQRQ
jgi:hypothetical protein